MTEKYMVMTRLSNDAFRDMYSEDVLNEYLKDAGFDLAKEIEVTSDKISGDLIYEQVGERPLEQ